MSVILEALRRSRGQTPGHASAPTPPAGVPSVLVARPVTRPLPTRRTPKAGGTRWGLLAGVVVLAGVVWAGIQLGPRFLQRSAPAPTVEVGQVRASESVPAAAAAAATEGSAPRPEAVAQETKTAVAIAEMVDKITAPPAVVPRTLAGTPPRARSVAASEARQSAKGATAAGPPALGAAAVRSAARSEGSLSVRRGGPSGPPSLGAAGVPPRPPLPAPPVPVLTSPAPAAAAPIAVTHFALAVRYHRLGNFEQALTSYTAALQADEFNVEARNNLGLLYHERGLTDEAIEQFRRAILIDPKYLRARSNLAVVLLGRGRLAEARAELRAALAIDPRNVDLLVNMALVDKADRQPELARETLLRALGLQATHAAAHYNLAILYDEAGDLARAQDHYNEFLKYAGPEYGTRLADVRRRIDLIAPGINPPQP